VKLADLTDLLATPGIPRVPDIGPGMAQARDADLDAEAQQGMTPLPLAPAESESEREMGEALDNAIEEARDAQVALLPPPHDPLLDHRRP
jgi:hypothetical protein